MKILSLALIASSLLIVACNNNQTNQQQNSDSTKSQPMKIPDAKAFQQTIDGKQTNLLCFKK